MKNINDICIIVNARLGSQRIPKKMIKPFNGSTLLDILLTKLTYSNIPNQNIYLSAYENELKDIANKHSINIFSRSEKSSISEGEKIQDFFEWYNKLPFKYVIIVSACNPLLKIETIDNFIQSFIESNKEGAFAVFEKKTYYWDKNKINITDWKNLPVMNTKFVDPVYEAAHCLYASRMDIIGEGMWMSTKGPDDVKLFVMEELEAFDIDEPWQFKVAEQLYKNKKDLWIK
jgi:N-acylneuraminate cytidylyltransferase